jgi:transcriptional regulator
MPEILDPQTNLQVLARLVEHFERHVEAPMLLDLDWAAPVARGTVGIRLPITRFDCKIKMSQDKDPRSQRQVIEALRRPGPYQNLELADEMQRRLGTAFTPGAE